MSFTDLKADASGVVTVRGPLAGEVVQAGQMIIRLARKDGRDAVFEVPDKCSFRSAPTDPKVTVTLTDDPAVVAQGRVREVAPQANPVTRNFEVKVGLTDPPPAMRLAATVTGRMETEAVPIMEIPASALTEFNHQPAVWIVDPSSRTVSVRNVDVLRFDQATVAVDQGLDIGEIVVTAGVQALHPGQRGAPARVGAMTGFNLSEWALKHRSLTLYFMIVAVVAGITSYFRLGRSEDPSFIIKTMVVQAAWPGATVEDTLKQVTERLERKLQETPKLDFLRSFTRAGVTTIFVNLKGSTTAREVPDIWYHVRKSIGDIRHTLPTGIIGPGFNDEFGDTFGIIYGFTADGFTQRELRDYVEDVRSKLLHEPDVSKIEILGAQDEKIFVEFSIKELASLNIDRSALIAALQAQNVVQPAGAIQTGNETLLLQVSGAFRSEQDVANVNFVVGDRILRLSDIARVRRSYSDPPPATLSRKRQAGNRHRHRHARGRRHSCHGQEHSADHGGNHR